MDDCCKETNQRTIDNITDWLDRYRGAPQVEVNAMLLASRIRRKDFEREISSQHPHE